MAVIYVSGVVVMVVAWLVVAKREPEFFGADRDAEKRKSAAAILTVLWPVTVVWIACRIIGYATRSRHEANRH